MKFDLLPSITAVVNKLKALGRHHYFIFVTALLCGLAVAVFVVNQTLSMPTDTAYRDQKIKESLDASFDRATIEKIENLQKSNESSNASNTAKPGARTNPFAE